jgi:hypothetical protein
MNFRTASLSSAIRRRPVRSAPGRRSHDSHPASWQSCWPTRRSLASAAPEQLSTCCPHSVTPLLLRPGTQDVVEQGLAQSRVMHYWADGPGADLIGWKKPGGFDRCVIAVARKSTSMAQCGSAVHDSRLVHSVAQGSHAPVAVPGRRHQLSIDSRRCAGR